MTQAADTNAWKQRAVYQVLTDRFSKDTQGGSACSNLSNYCGGTWKGIQNNLDYIQGMGFDAIWISPIVKNIEPGYHGYWASNWEEVNEHNGTEQDLINLVNAAHAKGIYVMVDVVANHSGPIGTDYSKIYPLNKAEHYHSRCDINWSDQGSVEYCRLADLPDLNQDGNSWVRQYLKDWVKGIVDKYNFDGIRIDTIPEVPKDFWKEYGASAGVFQMGECFNGDPAYVGPYQSYLTGLFNYPMYYTILDVFGSGQSMNKIENRYNAENSHFNDLHALGVFVDNHDNARFLHSHSNHANFTAAIIFSLTSQGIPFVYYGSEQYYSGGNDPANRESLW
jgi:alpha-amylase